MQTIIGRKTDQTQKFLENGMRIPVTVISAADNAVVQVKTDDKEKYTALQMGFGKRKKANKALVGHLKKANIQDAPQFLYEVRVDAGTDVQAGTLIKLADVLKPGDIVQVTGISKGKGWAGGVKRYHFKGGPRTHGQSDRERAPGSIGQTTTPGRVYKGKHMAGRMGQDRVTVKNLVVVSVNGEELLVSGLVPGSKQEIVIVTKIGEMSEKKFVPLHGSVIEEPEAAPVEEQAVVAEEQAAQPEETPAVVSEPEKEEKNVEEVKTEAATEEAPVAEVTPEEVKAEEPAVENTEEGK